MDAAPRTSLRSARSLTDSVGDSCCRNGADAARADAGTPLALSAARSEADVGGSEPHPIEHPSDASR